MKKSKKESEKDVKSLLLHLESEYRKANISERHYKELKEKYQKMLKEHSEEDKKIKKEHEESEKKAYKHIKYAKAQEKIHKKLEAPKKEKLIEPKEIEPEETESEETVKEEPEVEETLKEIEGKAEKEMAEQSAKEKKGFLKSIFGKKEKQKETQQPEAVEAEQLEVSKGNVDPPSKGKKKEKEEEITEITPEVIEKLAQQAKEQSENKPEEAETGEKKSGFLKSIFGKKKEEQEVRTATPEPKPATEPATTTEVNAEPMAKESKLSTNNYDVEIEKIKVMLDTVKETGHVTDETIRNVSESVGEIRSMVFQADAELKENAIKMEKMEDEVAEIKPQEISKKLREFTENFEKQQLRMEMLERKSADAGEKINKILEMLKSIGGIENLININSHIQQKLEDINEAMKYIERIGTKTEKMFIDLNKGLQDLVLIKAKQDDFNESLKDMIKNMDSLNVKFESYVTKKDLDAFKEDNVLIKKDIEDIKKALPIVELKLPETLINLRKEREDVQMLLESLEDQMLKGKIPKIEYETMRSANMEKLDEIRAKIEKEWKKVEELLAAEKEGTVVMPEPVKPAEEKKEPATEVTEEKSKEIATDEEKKEKPTEALEEKPEDKAKEKKGLLKSLFGKKKEEQKEAQPSEIKEEPEEETEEEMEEIPKKKKKNVKKKQVVKKSTKKEKARPEKPTKKSKPKKNIMTESKRKSEILSSLKKLS